MTRKSFPVLLLAALYSIVLAGIVHSVTDAEVSEPALQFPVEPIFLHAEAPVCIDSILGDATTSLTIECGECLAECMNTTGQNATQCRAGMCMWPCND